jgi:hypothetical protein
MLASIVLVIMLGIAALVADKDKAALIINALPAIIFSLTGWNVAMYTVNRGGNAADNFAAKVKNPLAPGDPKSGNTG